MRLIPRKELNIKDDIDELLEGKKSIEDVVEAPKSIVSRMMEEKGYVEDNYEKEHKLQLVHKLILRGATTKEIAKSLNISLSEAVDYRKELKSRFTEQLRKADPMELVSEGVSFYDEIIAEAMRTLDKVKRNETLKVHDLVRVLEIALKARTEKDKFLVNTGILNNNQETEPDKEDAHKDSARKVRSLVSDIMSQEDEELE